MPIKSEIQAKELHYPALMEYDLIGENYVVLMSEPGIGMVVKSNVSRYPVGTYKENWPVRIGYVTYFRPCPYKVVLSNG
jgi:hypothetical protein